MPKLSFSDGLALVGIAAGILFIVLDKAGKLTGWRLLLFLSIAAVLVLPAVLSWSWVADAQGESKFTHGLLMVCLVGVIYSLIAVWVTPTTEYKADLTPTPSEIKGRHLTEWQRGRLMSYVSAHPGTKIRILVSEGQETLAYANDFLNVFKKAGWATEGPKAAPVNLLVMDTRLSADSYQPPRPEVIQLRETLKDMQIKTAKYSVADENIPRGWMVLWVGAESPPDWSPETVPPYEVPPKEFAGVKPDSLEGLTNFGRPPAPTLKTIDGEELKFSAQVASSPDSARPFGLRITLRTKRAIKQTRLRVLCDLPIPQNGLRLVFQWKREQMANVLVNQAENTLSISFDKPIWKPNKPLTFSLFTVNKIQVRQIFLFDLEGVDGLVLGL